MATHSNNFIRVRLLFEYPPPAVVDCRMCWLLVDLNKCRVVADLESVIREKFEFGRRSILSLFIEDCYLPHTESVYVVRDNDSVRVKVDQVSQVNGHSTSPLKEGSKKRQRPAEEDELEDKQKKKKKKRREESQEKQTDGDDGNKKPHEKHKKREKKRKEVETVTPTKKIPASVAPPVKSPKKLPPAAKTQKVSSSDSSSSEEEEKVVRKPATQKPATVNLPVKSPKKLPPAAKTKKASSSDSSSSSEEEDKAPKKPAPQKPAPKTPSAVSKVPPVTKPPLKKLNPPSSTSSDSSDEEESVKIPPKKKLLASAAPTVRENGKPQHAPSSLLSTNCAQKPSVSTLPPGGDAVQGTSSDSSEEEIQLVIRRPQLGLGAGGQAPWRGRGRGRGSPADRERGRGGGRGGGRGHSNSFEYNYNRFKEPTAETDLLTNISVVLQNGAESVPKPNYTSMPLLAAPPLVGQKIAFKLLELTENYTPEVSEYKEGKIVNFDPTTKQVELELLNSSQAPVEPGKFDLVYQNEDGSERVEYAVSRGSKVTERWDSLLEPRLII